jgi:pyruvate,water dikinase
MIGHVIAEARDAGAKIGVCGQEASDHPEYPRFLVECGIDSMSVSPDSFVAVKQQVASAEGGKK